MEKLKEVLDKYLRCPKCGKYYKYIEVRCSDEYGAECECGYIEWIDHYDLVDMINDILKVLKNI